MIGLLVTLLLAASVGSSSAFPKCSNQASTVLDTCPDVPCLTKVIKYKSLNSAGTKAVLEFKPKRSQGCKVFKNFAVESYSIAPKCTGGSGSCTGNRFPQGITEGQSQDFEAAIIGGPRNCRARICMFFVDDKIQRRKKISLNGRLKMCVKQTKTCNACRTNATVQLPKEWCLKTKETAKRKIKNRKELGKQLVRSKSARKVGYYSKQLENKVKELVKAGCDENNPKPKPWRAACAAIGLDRIADVGAFVSNSAGLNAPITQVIKDIKQEIKDGATVSHFAVMEFDECPALKKNVGPGVTLKRGDGKNGFAAIACGTAAPQQQVVAEKKLKVQAKQPADQEKENAQKILELLRQKQLRVMR